MALASAQCPGQTCLPALGAPTFYVTETHLQQDWAPRLLPQLLSPTEQGSRQWDTHPHHLQAAQQASLS